MNRFVFLSFAFLGWAFYEASGGSEFQPRSAKDQQLTTYQPTVTSAPIQTETAPQESSGAITITGRISVETLVDPLSDTIEITRADEASSMTFKTSAPLIEEDRVGYIAANNVNLRTGPGTGFFIVATLPKQSPVYVMEDEIDNWVKLRSLDTGRVGWMMRKFIVTSDL